MAAKITCGYYDYEESKDKHQPGRVIYCKKVLDPEDSESFIAPFIWSEQSKASLVVKDISKDTDVDKNKDKGPFPYPRGDLKYWHRCKLHCQVRWVDSFRDRKEVVQCVWPETASSSEFNRLVTLVAGHTGCGKTVGTPLFLVEEALNRGSPCKFYVAVPNKKSADNVYNTQMKLLSHGTQFSSRLQRERPLGPSKNHVPTQLSDSSTIPDIKVFSVTHDWLMIKLLRGIMPSVDEHGQPNERCYLKKKADNSFELNKNCELYKLTHIIVDEVHQRDFASDMLCLLAKELLHWYKRRPISDGGPMRLILMSATVNKDIFRNYYSSCTLNGLSEGINMPKDLGKDQVKYRTIHVEELAYIYKSIESPIIKSVIEEQNFGIIRKGLKEAQHQLAIRIVEEHVINNYRGHLPAGEGTNVLIFESGNKEIETLAQAFKAKFRDALSDYNSGGFIRITEASSEKLSLLKRAKEKEAEYEILKDVPAMYKNNERVKNKDKIIAKGNELVSKSLNPRGDKEIHIIISTNAIESSVTINFLDTVIDFGREKSPKFDEYFRLSVLPEKWISLASSKQRAGRTGREAARVPSIGSTVFKLYQREEARLMDPYNKPAILRGNLDETILDLKGYALEIDYFKPERRSLETIFGEFLESPSSAAIERSLSYLDSAGMISKHLLNQDCRLKSNVPRSPLDTYYKDGQLTVVGYFVQKLKEEMSGGDKRAIIEDIILYKMIYYGVLLGVGVECVVMATAIASYGPKKIGDLMTSNGAKDGKIPIVDWPLIGAGIKEYIKSMETHESEPILFLEFFYSKFNNQQSPFFKNVNTVLNHVNNVLFRSDSDEEKSSQAASILRVEDGFKFKRGTVKNILNLILLWCRDERHIGVCRWTTEKHWNKPISWLAYKWKLNKDRDIVHNRSSNTLFKCKLNHLCVHQVKRYIEDENSPKFSVTYHINEGSSDVVKGNGVGSDITTDIVCGALSSLPRLSANDRDGKKWLALAWLCKSYTLPDSLDLEDIFRSFPEEVDLCKKFRNLMNKEVIGYYFDQPLPKDYNHAAYLRQHMGWIQRSGQLGMSSHYFELIKLLDSIFATKHEANEKSYAAAEASSLAEDHSMKIDSHNNNNDYDDDYFYSDDEYDVRTDDTYYMDESD